MSENIDIVTRFRKHYLKTPPQLSFGESKGSDMRRVRLNKREQLLPIGQDNDIVFQKHFSATNTATDVQWLQVDECLIKEIQITIPDTLVLPPEMEGMEIDVLVYINPLNIVFLKAIGGYFSDPKDPVN